MGWGGLSCLDKSIKVCILEMKFFSDQTLDKYALMIVNKVDELIILEI